MAQEHSKAESALRDEIAGLGVDDILALCYAFSQNPQRMALYMDVLRQQGGQRAQFASCLICYDLARQGNSVYQREFGMLADTVRALAQNEQLIANLVGADPYLEYIWELCKASLEEADDRYGAEATLEAADVTELATVDLLSDEDFGDFGLSLDDSELWLQFDEAVEAFLGGRLGVPVYEAGCGFRLKNSRDVDRVETFLQALDSLRDVIPLARGYRALVLLFYGTRLRSKSLFGSINDKKARLLRMGLEEMRDSHQYFLEVQGVLTHVHAGPEAWPKIADVLEDYVRWLAEDPRRLSAKIVEYPVIERMVARYADKAWLETE